MLCRGLRAAKILSQWFEAERSRGAQGPGERPAPPRKVQTRQAGVQVRTPARVSRVHVVDAAAREAQVIVPDYQLSLAIGKEGQNARLAARLTGWRIDIRSDAAVSAAPEDSPATPDAPDAPDAPEAQHAPDAQHASGVPEAQHAPEAPGTPDAPDAA